MALTRFLFLMVGLLFALCPQVGRGQQKQLLTGKDYGLWSTLYTEQLSGSGNWVSYRKDYQRLQDTLFARNTGSEKTYAFADALHGEFVAEDFFVCQLPEGRLALTGLNTGRKLVYENVSDYAVLAGNRYLTLFGSAGGSDFIEIRTMEGMIVKRIEQVSTWKVSRDGEKLFYAYTDDSGSHACIFSSDNSVVTIADSNSAGETFVNVGWNNDGAAVAFFQKDANGYPNGAYAYHLAEKRLYKLNPDSVVGFPKSMKIHEGYNPIVVSDDGRRVFLRLQDLKAEQREKDAVQVWNGNDKRIYPQRMQFEEGFYSRPLGEWQLDRDTFEPITSDSLPKVMMGGAQRYAITFNPMDVKAQPFSQHGAIDFFITDLDTGIRKRWLEGHPSTFGEMLTSPGGKYLVYTSGNDWVAYEFATERHLPLNPAGSNTKSADPYGDTDWLRIVGFSPNDCTILMSDGTDIWESDPVAQTTKRLTDGTEKKIEYSFIPAKPPVYEAGNFDGAASVVIDAEAGFYLYGRDRNKRNSGYFFYSHKDGLQKLAYSNALLDDFRISNDGRVYVYQMQRFTQPPVLVKGTPGSNKQRVFLKSNTQHDKYLWGTQEMVAYSNSDGETLEGILHYPAGYVIGNQYPMVVMIYQRLSNNYHRYVNPQNFSDMGFNVADYLARGYLVLLPDITYVNGNPGFSALEWVNAAVDAVAAKGCLKSDAVGLIGHSFGGYETNFIITHTGRFAAAVSGAGVSDTPRSYLTLGVASDGPNIWRYEHQQLRMGKSLFEDREGYRRNSPLESVAKMSTPLLSWTGGSDPTVNPEQTIGFYLAMHRLQKKQVMLYYPGEPHALLQDANQLDLSNRVRDWFDHYLKGEKKAWITVGTK